MSSDPPLISVAIPLYNKEAEIAATLQSVLAQEFKPVEIIVVNDGSKDRSAEVVAEIAASVSEPPIRLVDQPNSGVSVARNHAAELAEGDYVALLDGDDTWEPGYLRAMAEMIELHPGCGVYSAAFAIHSGGKTYSVPTPATQGVLDDFFREASTGYICQPSTVIIPKRVLEHLGGFPEGMKIGEDLYLWIKIGSEYPVCFTPRKLVGYNRSASNRSASIYTPEKTAYSYEEFYRPEEGNSPRNEYIARCALGKAITLTAKGDTEYGKRTRDFFNYTRLHRRQWHKLNILLHLPRRMRPWAHRTYTNIVWTLFRKGGL